MVNANAVSILDIDDGNRQAMGHPGGAIVPAVLAVAQDIGSPRADVLSAIVVGYEVAVRVGASEQRPSYHSANYTCFGVAAATAYLRELPVEQTAHALGIVGYYGPRLSNLTLSQEMSSNVKESLPWSVVPGIIAADLAAAGFTGNRDVLDIAERFDTAKLLGELGESFAIERTYFKKYSCCRWIHSAIEAALDLQLEHGFKAGDIELIEVETFTQADRLNNQCNPPTLTGAQFSVPYCLALALTSGEAALMPLREEALGQSEAVALADKVHLSTSERMDAVFPDQVPAIVTIHTGTQQFTRRVDDPWGEARRPPSDAELVDKLRNLARYSLPDGRIDALVDAVLNPLAPMQDIYAALQGRSSQ